MTSTLDAPLTTRGAAAPRVLILSGSVGAGHDGAARELAAGLAAAGAGAEVRDFLDALPLPLAVVLRDGYALAVDRAPAFFEGLFLGLERKGVIWGGEQALCALGRRRVLRWVQQARPDVVVSTYPLASQALGQLRESGRLRVPFVTYLTDPAVHASWLHPAAADHLVVTPATARQGRLEYGVGCTVVGPLVHPRFTEASALEHLVALRARLGLEPGRPVALLVAGSLGMGDVVGAARDVAGAGWVPLVLCGRNEGLRRRVARVAGAVALGWRDDVHELMQVADVLVHNAGGLAVTEAMVSGLPAVTYRSITGHGRANARVLADGGLAPWPTCPEELGMALEVQRRRGRSALAASRAAAAVLSSARSSAA